MPGDPGSMKMPGNATATAAVGKEGGGKSVAAVFSAPETECKLILRAERFERTQHTTPRTQYATLSPKLAHENAAPQTKPREEMAKIGENAGLV